MNSSRAPSQLGTRGNPNSPTIRFPPRATDHAGLNQIWGTLSVSAFKLYKLKDNVNQSFKKGDIVCTSNELRTGYTSPTKYSGQTPNPDLTTNVRIFKWGRIENVEVVESENSAGARISHSHLVDPSSGAKGPNVFREGTLVKLEIPRTPPKTVYQLVKMRTQAPSEAPLVIPSGTVGEVIRPLTNTGHPLRVDQGQFNPQRYCYILGFWVVEKRYGWLPCADWIPVGLLQELSPEEEQQARADIAPQQAPRPPQRAVVSMTRTGS